MNRPDKQVRNRLKDLQKHLQNENKLLVQVVKSFSTLDRVAYQLGYLKPNESYAFQVPWWPLISVLGTFSAGKSSFINYYLKNPLQETGAQAVDDKFTVICFSGENVPRTLPGIALDADPRFPFYQMREELDKVEMNEGARIDSYLQLKTCPSEKLMGRIFIDSPGFDADAQRTATLRITDYIMELSDLVLVLFDARRPEPGGMRDTLKHLVGDTIHRSDANKFMYILNHIDTTAQEDNPEEVVGAWQRAIAQEGLTAGKFYTIYNPEQAAYIEDDVLRQRFESKRDKDLGEIHERINQVSVERYYRTVAALEKTVQQLENELLPRLREMKRQWRWGIWWRSGVLFGLVIVLLLWATMAAGYWQGTSFNPPGGAWVRESWWRVALVAIIASTPFIYIHFLLRRRIAAKIRKRLEAMELTAGLKRQLDSAWVKNTRWWQSTLITRPVGWGLWTRNRLRKVVNDADRYIQELNNRYTNPSGEGVTGAAGRVQPAAADAVVANGGETTTASNERNIT